MASALVGLKQLESLKSEFGPEAAKQKQACLRALASAPLKRAAQIARLHDTLCFMQAWPDDEAMLRAVDAMLDRFDRRRDLKRHVDELASSGIAGTPINFRFFAVTAKWLADRWPDRLHVDWASFDNVAALERYLELLGTYGESAGLESIQMEPAEWVDRLKGPDETDAHFVIRRLAALIQSEPLREQLFDELDIPLTLDPGPGGPCRTRARYEKSPIVYQAGPLVRTRPDVLEELDRPLGPARLVSRSEGTRLIDLARAAMVARDREIDGFAYADAHDVSVVDDDGLEFVVYGLLPQRRFLLETLYGILVLKNGVPVSYAAATCLFNSAEVAYSLFDEFRGGESARIYVRVLSVVRQVLGCDTFMVDPYQLGLDNDDAIASGAWWFYQKLGFRPRDAKLLRLMRRELSTMKQRPRHRSSRTTLKQLATENVYLSTGESRDDVMGVLDLANVALEITDLFARRFGSEREQGERTLAAEAATRLGVTSFRGWSASEKLAWRRWSPVVALLEDLERWPAADRKALATLIRAKGGTRELEYLRRFDGFDRLRAAIVGLAEG